MSRTRSPFEIVRDTKVAPSRLDFLDVWDADVNADGSFRIRGLAHIDYVLMDGQREGAATSSPQFTRGTILPGMTFVDARAGSVSDVVLVLPSPIGQAPAPK